MEKNIESGLNDLNTLKKKLNHLDLTINWNEIAEPTKSKTLNVLILIKNNYHNLETLYKINTDYYKNIMTTLLSNLSNIEEGVNQLFLDNDINSFNKNVNIKINKINSTIKYLKNYINESLFSGKETDYDFKLLSEALKNAKTINYQYDSFNSNINELNNFAENELKQLKNLYHDDLKNISVAITSGKTKLAQDKLAKSFDVRSKDLDDDCKKWYRRILYAITLIVLLSTGSILTAPNLAIVDYHRINIYIRGSILHLPLFIALFWLLWFCTKQYSYSCKLRDDYHYKSDLSIAFQGYSEEAAKLSENDNSLRLALLDIVIRNIGKNPIDPNSPEYHSPYAEIIDKCFPVIKRAKNSTKEIVKATNE